MSYDWWTADASPGTSLLHALSKAHSSKLKARSEAAPRKTPSSARLDSYSPAFFGT